jgi:hypothetical protein
MEQQDGIFHAKHSNEQGQVRSKKKKVKMLKTHTSGTSWQ